MEISWGDYTPRTNQIVKKLSLEKDEQARVAIISQGLQRVWVHNFEKIVTDERGRVIEVEDKWPDGSPRIKPKSEYAGKFRCLGDTDTVTASGVDPKNCPACAAHVENSNAVMAPKPRFLVQVIKYRTKAGSFNVAKPFAAELIAWDLTDSRAQQLKAIYDEHGDLTKKDLLLGPCESKSFQNYTIQTGEGTAQYLKEPEYITELVNENQIEDLASVAGKTPSEEEMRMKASEIVRAYNHAYGIGVSSPTYESVLNSDDDEEEEEAPRPRKKTARKQPAPPPAAEDTDDEEDDDYEEDEDSTADLESLLASLGTSK